MNKKEVLELINKCENAALYALGRKDNHLSKDQESFLKKQVESIKKFKEEFVKNVPESDDVAIAQYHEAFSKLYDNLKVIGEPASTKVRPNDKTTELVPTDSQRNSNQAKVKAVVHEEEQSEVLKKDRNNINNILKRIFYVLGSAAAIAIVIATIKYFIDTAKDITLHNKANIASEQSIGPNVFKNAKLLVADVDIDDYTSLMNYATEIKNLLNDSTITIDDIMYAIRMANYDRLADKNYFFDREGVCRSTYNAGVIASIIGSDAVVKKDLESDIFITDAQMIDILLTVTDNKLTLTDFEIARVEGKGYDIFAVVDKCIKGMYEEAKEGVESKNKLYAMVFNDVISRATRNFTIVNSENAPLSTMYVLLGMYNANTKKILELTSGQLLGPIYGNGARIDGNYGDICVEELVTATYITRDNGQYVGSNECIFYTDFIDEVILNEDPNMGSR